MVWGHEEDEADVFVCGLGFENDVEEGFVDLWRFSSVQKRDQGNVRRLETVLENLEYVERRIRYCLLLGLYSRTSFL